MNRFIFSGNLGHDAEVSATQNGTAVCKFSVAVKSGYGEREQTTWVNCVIFGKRAESRLTEYLIKRQKVLISGELTLREYQKRDGTLGSSLEVVADDIELIGDRSAQAQPQQSHQPSHQPPPQAQQGIDDEIPF